MTRQMLLRPGRYFWKLFIINGAVVAVILAPCLWVVMEQFRRFREEAISRHLLAQATVLKVAVGGRFARDYARELNELARQVGSAGHEDARVTFILADGTVIGDSSADFSKMGSHADRPEVIQALERGFAEVTRWSHTVTKGMKYVAVRVGPGETPRGVVRVSIPSRSIGARTEPVQRLLLTIGVLAVLSAILLALALALVWSRRIRRITTTAQSISRGDLSARVDVLGEDEVAQLGRSVNRMRDRLLNQLDTIDRQRRTLDSLISQLGEGVVVADGEGRIVLINSEAVEILQLMRGGTCDSCVGLALEHCVPQRRLQDMLRSGVRRGGFGDGEPNLGQNGGTAKRPPAHSEEIELQLTAGTDIRTVLARAFDVRLPAIAETSRSDRPATHVGRALVLTDITELAKAMQAKADLAANASHELRTPLSAIRAAVDTLKSIDWNGDPSAAAKFVGVLDRQSARMEAMIADLLELSRLESGTNRFESAQFSAKALLDELRSAFAAAVADKRLNWKTSLSDPALTCTVSIELLRITLRNLIDNAIRFTAPGGEVEVSCRPEGAGVVFEVADTGCGIAAHEQRRIFERFYQVERARSGPDRGTGLGLSIVRHAVAAMNARVSLQSTLGKGTRVTIQLTQDPRPEARAAPVKSA